MSSRSWILVLFLVALTVARLVIAAHSELSPDEAYYDLWAQHPDVYYYSGGPVVALAILAGTTLFGHSELGVRLFSPLLALGTSLILYFLARNLFRERVAFWSVVALNLTPIFNIDALVMTTDALSIFFWTAALACFWSAVQQSPRHLWLWAISGILIGCGFLSNYANAVELISVLIFLVAVPRHRPEFRRPGIYILLICFALSLLPPLIWNWRHDWIGLANLSSQTGFYKRLSFHVSAFARFVGDHLILYSPLFFGALVVGLFGSIPRVFRSSKVCFLLTFSLPILLIYSALAFGRSAQPSWTIIGFISLSLLAVAWWHNTSLPRRVTSIVAVTGLVLAGAMSLLTLDTDLLRIAGIKIPYSQDASSFVHGWKTAAEEIQRLRVAFEEKIGEPVFLIGNRYQTAAIVSFYLPDPRAEDPGHPPVYIPESQDIANEFAFWPRYDEFVEPADKSEVNSLFTEQTGVNQFINRTALYVTDYPEDTPPQNLQNSFTRWELVGLFQVDRRNAPLREFRVFACYQYQTLPL